MKMRLVLVALALFAGGALVHASELEKILSIPPQELVQQAAAAGDTRFMAIPECGAVVPDAEEFQFLPSPYQKGEPSKLDPACDYVYGAEGTARLKKLESYAKDFNMFMLEYVTKMGMLPVYPVDAEPYYEATAVEKTEIESRSKALLVNLLGSPSPELYGTRLWKTDQGIDSRLFIETKLSASDFARQFPVALWKEIPLPVDVLEPMHLPRRTPKSSMTCFVGKVGGLLSYVFWSEELGSFLLMVAFDGAQPSVPGDTPASPGDP